jgi:hypothetical protein
MQRLSNLKVLVCFQLLIIVPGYQKDRILPLWARDLVTAISKSEGNEITQQEIDRSVVNLSSGVLPRAPTGIMIYDWSARSSGDNFSAQDSSVVLPMFQAIKEKIITLFAIGNKPVAIHLVGHSRGCYLLSAVLELLSRDLECRGKIGFVHVTTLDPHAYINDGKINVNPNGFTDRADNYFQLDLFPTGQALPGSLNVNLSSIAMKWDARDLLDGGAHSEVHDWYHWLWDQDDSGDPNESRYQDPVLNEQRAQFIKERKFPKTRYLLYGTNPIAENFNGKGGPAPSLFFSTFQGKGIPTGRGNELRLEMQPPASMPEENQLVKNALQLTGTQNYVSVSAMTQRTITTPDFTAEFSFRIEGGEDVNKIADGIAFVVLDMDHPNFPNIGGMGDGMGYAGMNGFAITFDPYRNWEHGDPVNVDRKVGFRINGSPKWDQFDVAHLPESVRSGNWFRARVELDSAKHQVDLLVYSHGTDSSVKMTKKLPAGLNIPKRKKIGVTSSTATYAARHTVDDFIVVPR